MIRPCAAFASIAAAILAIPAPAGASPQSDLAACEEHLARSPGGEAPALCLYEVAAGNGPSRTAASRRLGELAAKHPEDPWLQLYLGKLKRQTGEVEEAAGLYLRAADMAGRRGMAAAEFEARAGLCRISRDAGRLDEEAAEVARAVRVAESSGSPLLVLRASILRALHRNARGEFEQAFQILHPIQDEVKAGSPYPVLREHLFALAKAAQQTGRFHETRQAYRRVAEEAAAAGDLAWRAQALYGIAAVSLDELMEVPSARGRQQVLELARHALAAARAAGRPSLETQALWMLGFLGEAGEAAGHLERCYQVAATPAEQSFCRGMLARRVADAEPGKAQEAIHEAEVLAEKSGSAQTQVAFWSNRMRVSWQVNAPEVALADARAALDAIEALRDQQKGGAGQPGLFSTWAEHYYWLSGQLLQEGRLEPAFGVIERMRSRTLIDSLGLSPSDRQTGFASLAQVRGALARDEALLSFQIAPANDLTGAFGGGSWLLVATPGATRVYQLPERVWVRQALNAFTGLFTARDDSEAQAAASLYTRLLAPAVADLPAEVRRLVIVPDDFLHRLPFAALRSERASDPLVTRYEITLVPSATLWRHWREARPAPSVTPALVLADPFRPVTPGGTAQERSGSSFTPVRLGPLPYARTEGRSAVRHLGRGKLLVGEEASEAYVKRHGAGPFGLFHFAAHAVTNDVNPEESGIFLSPGTGREDGVLQVREIAELDVGGSIVVLSTCESASGEILRGEGVMGLARAFFQAGAHTVVASLWPLRDDDGAALFDRFYRHLSKGTSVAAALQAAQRDRMDDGAPAEAWAGVVVLGDGDRVPVPGGRGPGWTVWVLGLIAVLAAALLVRRYRKG